MRNLGIGLLIGIAIGIGLYATGATAHAYWKPHDRVLQAPKAHYLGFLWRETKRIRDGKCLSEIRPTVRYPWLVAQSRRDEAIDAWLERRAEAQAASSKCLPTTPSGIIRYVFPSATEDAAIRVAYCESRLYTYARNPSGASGLFQLMPTWWAGKFNPFNPWANTRFAYQLSDAGYNWSHWVCKP